MRLPNGFNFAPAEADGHLVLAVSLIILINKYIKQLSLADDDPHTFKMGIILRLLCDLLNSPWPVGAHWGS